MKILPLLALCFVPMLASATYVRPSAAPLVTLTGDTIEYRGQIADDAIQRAFDLFMHAERTPRTLHIESEGGSADAAMELGAWVFRHNLNVRVTTACLSSCASYVLPAGRIKKLAPHATLLWHGGATQPLASGELERILDAALADMSNRDRGEFERHYSRSQMLHNLEASHAQLIERETDYFHLLGVDPRIAMLGHLYRDQLLGPGEHYAGWDYSLEDLARLGVHDVIVEGERAWEPLRTTTAGRIYRLQLDRLEGFEPALSNENR